MRVSFIGTALLSLSLSACTKVNIKDWEFCGSLASKGAACFHTLTDESRTLTLSEFAAYWNDLSDPKVCTRASTFADIKADLEQLCSFNDVCTYEMKQKVNEVSAKLDRVVSKAKANK